jgi:5'-3' exonuclease
MNLEMKASKNDSNPLNVCITYINQTVNMGIKDLYKVIKSEASESFTEHHLSDFSGIRVAIDISIFFYKYIRTAGERDWMNMFIMFLCILKKNGIKAICIFDGPNPPIEKKDEQIQRRENTKKEVARKDKAIELRNLLQDDYEIGQKVVPEDIIAECQTIIRPRKGYVDHTDYSRVSDIINSLQITISRLEKSTLPITDDYRLIATNICEILGLKAIRAKGEAEKLCAYLAVNGQVDAVLTEDTDVLAYGTPCMLAFKDFKLGEERVHQVDYQRLLYELHMDAYMFRDMCIMLKCDYNSRTKGYPVDGKTHKTPKSLGVTVIPDFIREYKNIDRAYKEGAITDLTPLKHTRCRELFSFNDMKDVKITIPPYDPPDYERLEELIQDQKLSITIGYVQKCHKIAEFTIETDSDEDLDSE